MDRLSFLYSWSYDEKENLLFTLFISLLPVTWLPNRNQFIGGLLEGIKQTFLMIVRCVVAGRTALWGITVDLIPLGSSA